MTVWTRTEKRIINAAFSWPVILGASALYWLVITEHMPWPALGWGPVAHVILLIMTTYLMAKRPSWFHAVLMALPIVQLLSIHRLDEGAVLFVLLLMGVGMAAGWVIDRRIERRVANATPEPKP